MQPRYKGMNEGSGPATLTFLTYDIMETNYGDWFTIRQLTEQVRLLRPDAKAGTISRSVWRMVSRGILEQIEEENEPTRFRVADRDYWADHATG